MPSEAPDVMTFNYSNGTPRQILDPSTIDEIEKISLAKYYARTIKELKNNPKSFSDFTALRKAECGAFNLAVDYLTRLKKGLVTKNEDIYELANRFVKDAEHYENIKKAQNKPSELQKSFFVKILIQVVEECVEGAYLLALHRSNTLQNDNFEALKESTARLEQSSSFLKQTTNRTDQCTAEIKEKIDIVNRNVETIMAHIRLTDQIQEHVQPVENNQQEVLQTNTLAEPTFVGQTNEASFVDLANDQTLSWIVSQEKCQELFNSNKVFEREYMLELFTKCEILMPFAEISQHKKKEFFLVFKHFYPNKDGAEEIFERFIKNLKCQRRQIVFKAINGSHGYGISDKDIDFYYKLPINIHSECFSQPSCSVGSRLQTRFIGNMQIPRKCGDFNFIFFIEKAGRQANLIKLLPDGSIIPLKG